MSPTVIVATARPKPEYRAEVIAVFEQVIPQVHAEDTGCELYALHEADDRLVMIEKWADDDAVAGHVRSAGLAKLQAGLAGKLDGELDVQLLRPHPAGTAGQGTL
jgi:quinol monooxygenase YgiN